MSKKALEKTISEFLAEDPGNLIPGTDIRMFGDPLVGVAAADDPVFKDLTRAVRSDHRLPSEWLEGARSVVSYFLPFTEPVRESNRQGENPSEEWIYGRFYGAVLLERLGTVLSERMNAAGHKTVVPPREPTYNVTDMNSNWSERHVAYAAGLGTFGLSSAILTERGTAGRFGSLVTAQELEPTPRLYYSHREHCSHFSRASCGACIERCPSGALSPEGKDRDKCSHHLKHANGPAVRARYGFPYSPCGKCNVDVPCEERRPPRG